MIFGIELGNYQKYFWLVVVLMIIMLIIKKNIIDSRIGRAFIAIRENPHAAAGMGINVAKYKIMAFAISAFMAGLAGALYAHMVRFISPDTFTSAQSNMFMTMLLFGGSGTLWGPVLGVMAVQLINEGLRDFAQYQTLFYGVAILVVVLFMPSGLVNLKLKKKKTEEKKESEVSADA